MSLFRLQFGRVLYSLRMPLLWYSVGASACTFLSGLSRDPRSRLDVFMCGVSILLGFAAALRRGYVPGMYFRGNRKLPNVCTRSCSQLFHQLMLEKLHSALPPSGGWVLFSVRKFLELAGRVVSFRTLCKASSRRLQINASRWEG